MIKTTADLVAALRAADPDGTMCVTVEDDETRYLFEVGDVVCFTATHANATPIVRISTGHLWEDPTDVPRR